MMPKLPLIVALLLPLAACQQAKVRDEASPDSRLGVGSRVLVQQTVVVPDGHTRVFLQGGELVAKVRLDKYRPHCDFEVRTLHGDSRTISPDSFLVIRLEEDEEEVVEWRLQNQYASLKLALEWEEAHQVNRFVRHTLHSERQPDVMRLTCHGGFADAWQAHYPSISEIRRALGEWASVIPAMQAKP